MSQTSTISSPDEILIGNERYSVRVTISDGYNTDLKTLNTQAIDMLSYSNQMNRLYLVGFIDYIDNAAIVDKFLESDKCNLTINIDKIRFEGKEGFLKPTVERSISLLFLVTSFQILEYKPGSFKYRINIISPQYADLTKYVTYNNYGDKQETSTSIIQDILKNKLNIKTNDESFDKFKSTNKINYITNNFDTGFTSLKYLLNRTIYNPLDYDKSIKTLIFNELTNEITLFDNSIYSERLGVYNPIEIQVVKDVNEIGVSTDVNVGYTSKISRVDTFVDTKGMKFFDYNLKTNEFGNEEIKPENMIQILNGGIENKAPKYKNLNSTQIRYETSWNNELDLYERLFKHLTQGNGLIVNQHGLLGACPGYACSVTIPVNQFPHKSTNKQLTELENSQFQKITSKWEIYETTNYFSATQKLFKQKLILYRYQN